MAIPTDPSKTEQVVADDPDGLLHGEVGDPGKLGGIPMPDRPVNGTVSEYLVAWAKRIRYGESGVLPVVLGLIILIVLFQAKNSVFLSAGNITNLFIQAAVFVMLGMAEVFVLILGEIDLSAGFVAAIGATIMAILLNPPYNWPWWLAVGIGVLATSVIAGFQGMLVIRLRLPSFVVTLAGLLFWEGALIYLVNGHGIGGTIRISNTVVLDFVNGEMSPAMGWILMIAAVVLFGGYTLLREQRRRKSGLVVAPLVLTLAKLVVVAIAGAALVLICNTDRGQLAVVEGVPYAVPIVLAFVVMWTFVLNRLRFGRYLYAIGGNAEAARRGGVSLGWNRFWAFTLTGLTAGAAGILYASRLGSISNDIDGGNLVLLAVASAVIGGTSLFGGRGKMIHALLGGLVIATIYNGMGLLGMSAASQYMVTALVLLAAVTIDALARRGRTAR